MQSGEKKYFNTWHQNSYGGKGLLNLYGLKNGKSTFQIQGKDFVTIECLRASARELEFFSKMIMAAQIIRGP